MGVLEDTVVKAKEVIDIAGKKTGEVIAIQKLKVNAAQVNARIAKDYESLGRLAYDAHKTGKANEMGIEALANAIDAKYEELKEIELKIATAKGAVVCTACRAVNSVDAVFCSKCGAKLESCFEGAKAEEQPAAAASAPQDGE